MDRAYVIKDFMVTHVRIRVCTVAKTVMTEANVQSVLLVNMGDYVQMSATVMDRAISRLVNVINNLHARHSATRVQPLESARHVRRVFTAPSVIRHVRLSVMAVVTKMEPASNVSNQTCLV